MTLIERLLRETGPLMTTELINLISLHEPGTNKEAIRKRLSRVQNPIKRIHGFFIDNQTFYYLEDQRAKDQFYISLRNAFRTYAKRLDAIITAFEYNDGYLKKADLAAFTFSPVNKLKGHRLYNDVLGQLTHFDLVNSDENGYMTLHHKLCIDFKPDLKRSKTHELTRNFVLEQFNEWARNIGLVSFDAGKFYNEYGNLLWSYTAPSYAGSLKTYSDQKPTPGFVVADILINRRSKKEDVQFFLNKIDIIYAQKNLSRILPFLIVESVEQDALALLRKKGVVVGFVDQLFGRDYADLLLGLFHVMNNAAQVLMANPDHYLKIVEQLEKFVKGKTNNLRGDLFELAVGYYHSQQCRNIDLGKKIMYDFQHKEADVFAIYQNEIKIAECKGYKGKIGIKEVDQWLEKLPFFFKWILQVEPYKNKKMVAELWSTGGFTDDAISKLEKVSSATKKYKVEYFDKTHILEKARELNSPRFIDTLKQYYFADDI